MMLMAYRPIGIRTFRLLRSVALAAGLYLAHAPVQAQDAVVAFYKGKTISINIGLRSAFDQVVKNPDFLAQASKMALK
jgi:hypothetical protein